MAGPVEATAIGNIMLQAVADEAVGSIDEAREVVRRSFDVEEYEPRNTGLGRGLPGFLKVWAMIPKSSWIFLKV